MCSFYIANYILCALFVATMFKNKTRSTTEKNDHCLRGKIQPPTSIDIKNSNVVLFSCGSLSNSSRRINMFDPEDDYYYNDDDDDNNQDCGYQEDDFLDDSYEETTGDHSEENDDGD
jgi:hypothetical protein